MGPANSPTYSPREWLCTGIELIVRNNASLFCFWRKPLGLATMACRTFPLPLYLRYLGYILLNAKSFRGFQIVRWAEGVRLLGVRRDSKHSKAFGRSQGWGCLQEREEIHMEMEDVKTVVATFYVSTCICSHAWPTEVA